jgi:hypothetical protein
MNTRTSFALLGAIGYAAWGLGHGQVAYAAQNSGIVATTGSVFMSDEFSSTGPAGTLWQPLITRQDIGRLRYEVTVLRQIREVATAPASPGSPSWEVPALHTGYSTGGNTAVTLAYTVPLADYWHTSLTAKRYLSSPHQKMRLGISDYDALLLAMNGDFAKGSIEAGLGYKFKKPLAAYDIHNARYGYFGGAYDFNSASSIELFLDYRQTSTTTQNAYAAEVSARFVRRIGKGVKLEAYAIRGVTPGNRDVGGGLLLSVGY